MVITDRYDHLIDEKNRLAIPSQIRAAMDATLDGTAFYLVPEGRYLQMIPEKLFQRLANLAQVGLVVPAEVAKARRLMFAMASRIEPDKQGRVVIPERFLRDHGAGPFGQTLLGREVTLVGAGDRVELWDRADFESHTRELLADRSTVEGVWEKLFGVVPPAAGSDLPY